MKPDLKEKLIDPKEVEIKPDTKSVKKAPLTEEEQWAKKKKCYIILGVIFVVIVVCLLVFKSLSANLLRLLFETLKKINNISEPFKSIIFVLILFIMQMTFLPMTSSFVVVMSYVMGNFFHSILLQITATMSSSILTYFLARGYLNEYYKKKFGDTILYKIANEECTNNPWRINLMIRVMYVPVTVKNVILGLCQPKLLVYVVCIIPEVLLLGSFYTFIGLSLNNFEEYADGEKHEQSSA